MIQRSVERMVLIEITASMPVPVLARALLVAQLPTFRHERHVPLLAGGFNWPYRPDFIHACTDTLPQEPRVVGIL